VFILNYLNCQIATSVNLFTESTALEAETINKLQI
jgi:hypothetical protein